MNWTMLWDSLPYLLGGAYPDGPIGGAALTELLSLGSGILSALLGLGLGIALASWAGLTGEGPLFGHWKDHLDRGFMQRHRIP